MALTRAADEGFVIALEYDALNISTVKVFFFCFFSPVDFYNAPVKCAVKKYHTERREDGTDAEENLKLKHTSSFSKNPPHYR